MLSLWYVQEGGPGVWWPLDAAVVMEGDRIIRTKNPTGHAVLIDCRFEIPCGKFGCCLCAARLSTLSPVCLHLLHSTFFLVNV